MRAAPARVPPLSSGRPGVAVWSAPRNDLPPQAALAEFLETICLPQRSFDLNILAESVPFHGALQLHY